MKFRNLLVMSSVIACGLTLASCGQQKEEPKPSNPVSTPENSSPVVEETNVNVGIGYIASLTEGVEAQADVTAVMVAFDKDGKIVDSRLDVVQVKLKANDEKNGLALNLADNKKDGNRVLTKLELGKNYNMVTFGGAIAEVDAQIEAYAAWTKGKTVAELKADLAEKEGAEHPGANYASDPDLVSQCTISVRDFALAYEVAFANKSATAYKLSDGFKTGIAINASLAYNYGNPSVEVSVDIAGTVVAGGKVEACAIDAVVVHPAIGEDGALTLDASQKYHAGSTAENQVFKSKKVLGEGYAMRGASPTRAEWFEQAAAIEADVIGMNVADLAAKTEFAGATITVTSYASAIARAAEYATKEHIGPQAA